MNLLLTFLIIFGERQMQWITTQQAAEMAHLTPAVISYYIKKGTLHTIKKQLKKSDKGKMYFYLIAVDDAFQTWLNHFSEQKEYITMSNGVEYRNDLITKKILADIEWSKSEGETKEKTHFGYYYTGREKNSARYDYRALTF